MNTIRTAALAALLLPSTLLAQEVLVTRAFSAVWDQPESESQGITLQIVDQQVGKTGVAYWFTYGDDDESAWFLGAGPVSGNRIDMTLFQGSGIAFLEPDVAGDDRVVVVGTMTIEFSSCDEGEVSFDTSVAGVGAGSFPIERLGRLYATSCSGGISDDTPATVLPIEERLGLVPARAGVTGSGHADFEERPDRTEFSVEAEGIPNGSYRILVGGTDRGELVVSLGVGETEFRSPGETGKVLLTFDPRGEVIEVHDGQGAVLTSDGGVLGGGDDGGGGGGALDFGTALIEVELVNAGVYPAGSGDAKLEPRDDRTEFSVEIEDVPVGDYALLVGGVERGTIRVATLADGSVEGEIEFRNPVEPGKQLLDFDPRGETVEVREGSTTVFSVDFPAQ